MERESNGSKVSDEYDYNFTRPKKNKHAKMKFFENFIPISICPYGILKQVNQI